MVFNLHRFFSSGFLTAFSGAQQTIGFDKNPLSFLFSKSYPHQFGTEQNPIHEIERNASLTQHFDLKKTENQEFFSPKLYPQKNDYSIIPEGETYVCMAPFSIWTTKELPLEKWVELIMIL